MPNPYSDDFRCYLCLEPVGESGGWCYGCRHYICDNHLNDPLGDHEAEAHDDKEE